jgi:dTMP kinase
MIVNTNPGTFMVIEGLDGSGLSTQTKLLAFFLGKTGHKVLATKEPTSNSAAGKKIQKILNREESVSAQELQKLFAEDRSEHLERVIVPALQKGIQVISDRYAFSSFAFGGSAGVSSDWLFEANKDFLLPDYTFILQVSPAECIRRIQDRGRATALFEKQERLETVWEFFKNLSSEFEGIHMINGERPPNEVSQTIQYITEQEL